ncbi:pilus assembly protein PapD [Serratia sp. Ag1]|nr:pilus assembly protein PapD [Serratia sp. Ag2]KFK97457.1 pilus assembly protein PapD [Serratia sp. Ag1]
MIPAYRVRMATGLYLLISVQAMAAQTAASGGISLSQTRVVFVSTDKAQTLAVKNTGNQSYLIQSRVQQTPDDTTLAPFVVTPPLFPLKPDSKQLLRIIPQGSTLLTDRESLFYLAVLAIPAQASNDPPQAQISMGVRFIIKLFYRPANLKMSPSKAICNLRLSQTANGVRIENPTPYFQTLGHLKLNMASINLDAQPSMLAPMSGQNYSIRERVTKAEWQTVTDYGGLSTPCQQTVSSTQETP